MIHLVKIYPTMVKILLILILILEHNQKILLYVDIIVYILLIKDVKVKVWTKIISDMKSSESVVNFVKEKFSFCHLANSKFQCCIKY